jgi:hypothetical protein
MADTAVVAPDQQETVADALARRVQAGEDPSANRLGQALRELGAVDRAVYEAVARTPTATLDGPVRQLSGAADTSRLWLGIAAAVALAVPVRLLAAAVAYSRVHTGVHHPGDVVIGSVTGAGTAAMVAAVADRLGRARAASGRAR